MKTRSSNSKKDLSNDTVAVLDVVDILYKNKKTEEAEKTEEERDLFKFNKNLLNALIANNIRNVVLCSDMTLNLIDMFNRMRLIQDLREGGFIVHGVITPADYKWNNDTEPKIGRAFREAEAFYQAGFNRLDNSIDFHADMTQKLKSDKNYAARVAELEKKSCQCKSLLDKKVAEEQWQHWKGFLLQQVLNSRPDITSIVFFDGNQRCVDSINDLENKNVIVTTKKINIHGKDKDTKKDYSHVIRAHQIKNGLNKSQWEFRIAVYPSRENLNKAVEALEHLFEIKNKGRSRIDFKCLALNNPDEMDEETFLTQWDGTRSRGSDRDQRGKEISVYMTHEFLNGHFFQRTPEEWKELMLECWKALLDAGVEGIGYMGCPLGDKSVPAEIGLNIPFTYTSYYKPYNGRHGILNQTNNYNPFNHEDPLAGVVITSDDLSRHNIALSCADDLLQYRVNYLNEHLPREKELVLENLMRVKNKCVDNNNIMYVIETLSAAHHPQASDLLYFLNKSNNDFMNVLEKIKSFLNNIDMDRLKMIIASQPVKMEAFYRQLVCLKPEEKKRALENLGNIKNKCADVYNVIETLSAMHHPSTHKKLISRVMESIPRGSDSGFTLHPLADELQRLADKNTDYGIRNVLERIKLFIENDRNSLIKEIVDDFQSSEYINSLLIKNKIDTDRLKMMIASQPVKMQIFYRQLVHLEREEKACALANRENENRKNEKEISTPILIEIQQKILKQKWEPGSGVDISLTRRNNGTIVEQTRLTVPSGVKKILDKIQKAADRKITFSDALKKVEGKINRRKYSGHCFFNSHSSTIEQNFYEKMSKDIEDMKNPLLDNTQKEIIREIDNQIKKLKQEFNPFKTSSKSRRQALELLKEAILNPTKCPNAGNTVAEIIEAWKNDDDKFENYRHDKVSISAIISEHRNIFRRSNNQEKTRTQEFIDSLKEKYGAAEPNRGVLSL